MALQTFTAGQVLTAAQMTALQTNAYNQTVSTKTASYTLVAADVGTRIVMNSASATTITVNTSLFSAGDTVFLQNLTAGGVCTVTAGTATVTTSGSLALAANAGGTLYFTSASAAVFIASGVAASSGLVCVKAETAFSAVASVTADSVFTSTYTNYRVLVRFQTSAAAVFLQFGAATVYAATNYNWQQQRAFSTTVDASGANSQTSGKICDDSVGVFGFAAIEISGVQLAEATVYTAISAINNAAYTSPRNFYTTGNHSTATSYDGLKLLVSSGTMTGVYSIYGYNKTV